MNIPSIPKVLVLISLIASATATKAQFYNTDYWSGGSGTWNTDTANTNWSGSAWTNYSYANFSSATGGTVTVDNSHSQVIASEFDFGNLSSNLAINGQLEEFNSPNSATLVYVDPSVTANITLGPINVDLNPNNESSYVINNSVGTVLTIGNVNFQHSTDPAMATTTRTDQNIVAFGANGSHTVFEGMSTAAGVVSMPVFGSYGDSSTAIYEIAGPLAYTPRGGKAWDQGSGTILLDTASLGAGQLTFVGNPSATVSSVLTNVAGLNITNNIGSQNPSNSRVGSNVAGASTFSGVISSGGGNGNLDLYATDNSTVTFTNMIVGGNGNTTKSGNGTVILGSTSGNSFTSSATSSFVMNAGTTLIENGSSSVYSAFGQSSSDATLKGGATLGGNGTASQTVDAAGTSVISPGNPTAIGTLNLGGLDAASGLTMNFKLNGDAPSPIHGVTNDFLFAGNLTLGGTVNINLSAMDTLLTGTGNAYLLFSSNEATENDDLTYNVIAPTGYALDSTFGTPDTLGDGKDLGYEDDGGTFYVQLVAAPEPSTYPLMGLGVLALVGIRRFRRTGS